jgi:hypothetical protein
MIITIVRAWGVSSIASPYEAREIVKSIPGSRWDPGRKVWTVPTDSIRLAVSILESYGATVHVLGDAPGTPRESRKPPADWATALFKAAGPDLGERIYRALARVLHPDCGGDTELMQALNRARDGR